MMRPLHVLILCIAATSIAAGAQAPAKPEQSSATSPDTPHVLDAYDANAWLDGFIPYAIKSGEIAGAVIVIVKDGRVLTQRGFGLADVALARPVDPERTLFRPGSIAKLFTWTAVMQLVEAGKLDLDRDVNSYLDFRVPTTPRAPITLRHLMTHTAGFEEVYKGLMSHPPETPRPLGEAIKAWVPTRIFAPGQVPAYSNYGAALAGYIVERVSGEPFAEYMTRHILLPLGMVHSTRPRCGFVYLVEQCRKQFRPPAATATV
jgi:CubicO group peptidase (beta-lactamase class C family)